jgi:hypothetical protein
MEEYSSAAILGPIVAERFTTTRLLCTEIIEDFLPRVAGSERAGLRVAMDVGLAQQAADMQAHLEATRERLAASLAAIAELPLTGVPKVTEPTRATGDSRGDNQMRRVLVVSAAAAVSRADSLRMEGPAVRMVADTLAAAIPAVDTAAEADTVAADTAANAKSSV